MRETIRWVVAAIAFAFWVGAADTAGAADGDAARSTAWPQLASDIPADDSVRYGVLANGMRYAIMNNVTPRGQVTLRLRFDAGSLHEREDQRGLAHFLEHLAFRGSNLVPDGEVQRSLERLGLRMGGDTNASTAQTETVYRFDLPNNFEQTIATGMMLLREIASELTLTVDAMEKERGVVLSEERVGDNPNSRARKEQSAFLMRGQLAPRRFPIGEVEVIRSAPIGLVRSYYQEYYRPERATLLVVGDIDPDTMEARIFDSFSDWRGVGEPGPEPDLGVPGPRGMETALFAEMGAASFVTVSWVTPYDSTPHTVARERRDRIEALGLAILNQRLQRSAASPNPAFLNAGVSRSNSLRSANITALGATFESGQWQQALQSAEQVRRQIVFSGVRQDEVDREVGAYLTRLEARTARAATRTSTALVSNLLNSIDDGDVFTSPDVDHMIAAAQLEGLSAEEVSMALRGVFEGGGPLVFLSTSDEVEASDELLVAAYLEAQELPLTDESGPDTVVWPYTTFGPPGTVSEREHIEDLDATSVRFANGVRLTVKPTMFRDDQVLVEVRVGGGLLALPRDRPEAVWAAFGGGFVTGGLEALDYVDMRRVLAPHIYTTGFGTAENAFVLSGQTRQADLNTQLQVLTAYVVAPGWRVEAFERAQNGWATEIGRGDVNPAAVLSRNLPALLHPGDARWLTPRTADEVRTTRLADSVALIGGALARAPIEVTIVGDIDVERAIEAVATTFGALPERAAEDLPAPRPGEIQFPASTPEPVVLRHQGRADQGLAFVAWPTTDFFSDMREATTIDLLSEIISSRLAEELRAEGGATYSPQAGARSSLTFPGYGYLFALAEISPDRMPYFFDTIAEIVADISERGPNDDELERARKPAIDALERSMQSNGYWLGLRGTQTDARRLEMIRTTQSRLLDVTAADLRQAASKYLNAASAWQLVVVPES